MADELADLRRQIDRLPADVTAALRSVALTTAERVRQRARGILEARTGKADRIAAIGIAEDAPHKQFLVIAEGAARKPKNLALWFERGTRYMTAKPFMRPAADLESERYIKDGTTAAMRVSEKLGQ